MGAIQKVPELVVNGRMSHSKKKEKPKNEKKVPGWSTEEMKEKPNFAVEEDTEEMKKWGELNQSEIDTCWKKLAERMEEEVLDKYKGHLKATQEQEIQNEKVWRRLLGKNLLLVQRIPLTASAKRARGVDRRGGDEAAAKDGSHE